MEFAQGGAISAGGNTMFEICGVCGAEEVSNFSGFAHGSVNNGFAEIKLFFDEFIGGFVQREFDCGRCDVQIDVSRNAQFNMAGYDTLGACIFAGFGYAATPDGVVKRLLKARYGWDEIPDNILQELGKETIKLEREFNRRAGFTAKDDRLPGWMMKEELPENHAVFDVRGDDLDHIFSAIE